MKLDYERNQAGRMFQSDFFEAASKIHPVVPFALYIPIILALEGWALATGRTSLAISAAFIPLGWVTWQLMEYAIHRFFFHWEGSGPFTRKLHEISHGYHHKYPDDRNRLVMPIGASIPLAILIFGLLSLANRPDITVPYFVGVVGGYLWYDFLHWSTHARTPLTSWGRTLRSHHMAHHFNTPDRNYGISHRWIDIVVGTLRKRPVREAEKQERPRDAA